MECLFIKQQKATGSKTPFLEWCIRSYISNLGQAQTIPQPMQIFPYSNLKYQRVDYCQHVECA